MKRCDEKVQEKLRAGDLKADDVFRVESAYTYVRILRINTSVGKDYIPALRLENSEITYFKPDEPCTLLPNACFSRTGKCGEP